MRKKLPEYLLQLCRQFRKHPTETEAMLWECLRDRRLHGFKFRRQHPVGRYVADFYCEALKLIIEINGGIHNLPNQAEYDAVRQKELEDQGFIIVRVTTEEVKTNLAEVVQDLIPLSL